MKKVYFSVSFIVSLFLLNMAPAQAQDGFENYSEGKVPAYFSEVGKSKNAQLQVTTLDKWLGQKSLLFLKDPAANSWEPYFKAKFTYTLAPAALLSFCAKIPASQWLHFSIADSTGVEGPEFAFYGEWAVLAQNYHPGAIQASAGGNMTFPVDKWFKLEMTMKAGAAYDTTCTLKITELEDLKRTFISTGFKFKGRPGVAKKFTGSLKKATVSFYSDKNLPNTETGKVFLDELLIPSNTPITNVAQFENKMINCNIYPNPSTGYLRVVTPVNIDRFQIFNFEGKVVFEKENIAAHQFIDVSKLQNGIYAVKMISGKDQVSQKLILDK